MLVSRVCLVSVHGSGISRVNGWLKFLAIVHGMLVSRVCLVSVRGSGISREWMVEVLGHRVPSERLQQEKTSIQGIQAASLESYVDLAGKSESGRGHLFIPFRWFALFSLKNGHNLQSPRCPKANRS